MSHENLKYIIIQTVDSFDYEAAGMGEHNAYSPQGDYIVINDLKGSTAADIGYTPSMPYDQTVLDNCPNAPDATWAEARALFQAWYPHVTMGEI